MNFIENETSQKLRGGYYTPLDLAEFISRWIREISPETILEPSCGDGAFFTALASVGGFEKTKVTGFELDSDEAQKASQCAKQNKIKAKVHSEDFLNWALNHFENKDSKFDAVVGNPPFIRYQYLPAEFQTRAEKIFNKFDCRFTKHTNAWVPFILASLAMLRPGGRLAMVVPSEIIHITHAQSLRTYLGEQCKRIVIIDPEELWFSDTLQGAVILLAEKRGSSRDKMEGLGIYSANDRSFTQKDPGEIFAAPQAINGKTVEGKWTRALLNKRTRDLFDEIGAHPDVHHFNDIAEVDVGIVTGANQYFLVNNEIVENYKLQKWSHPMFGRSDHCPGIIYDDAQHQDNARQGKPTNFIWFQDSSVIKNKAAKEYIALGEEQKLQTRFKCRMRSPWYTVPSVYTTEIGMLKRAHNIPRLILNKVGAYTTDTAYRIRTRKADAQKLVACFLNPLTALSAELEGRHYGGGVLELVPSEIEKLTIPMPQKLKLDLVQIDQDVRNLTADQVLRHHGGRVLGALGLSVANQDELLEGWWSLRNRRHRVSGDTLMEAD